MMRKNVAFDREKKKRYETQNIPKCNPKRERERFEIFEGNILKKKKRTFVEEVNRSLREEEEEKKRIPHHQIARE